MADELLKTHGPRQLAAAFVKMYRAGLPAPEDIEDEPFQRDTGRRASTSRGQRRPRHEGPQRERAPREHAPRDEAPREPRPGRIRPANASMRPRMSAAPHRARWPNGVWFRLNVGRERNADPKWLLPEICRQGEVTKKDIGAIRVFEMETLFQIDPAAAPKFTILVSERKKGGVRISPALDQTGAIHRAAARNCGARGDAPGDAPPRKPGFHGKKFGGKKTFGSKKFGGKPGGGYKGKNPRPPKPQS